MKKKVIMYVRQNHLIDDYHEFQLPNLSEQVNIHPLQSHLHRSLWGISDELTKCIPLILAIYLT